MPWVPGRPAQMAELHVASIGLSGPAAPGLLEDLDPGRIGRDTVALVEWADVIDRREVSWTDRAGAQRGVGAAGVRQSEDDPLAALWDRLATVCRLDEPDSSRASWGRSAELRRIAGRLDAADPDSLRFRGPGTDLVVGLLPDVGWHRGGLTTAWGRDHLPNLPTEEVFTSPIRSRGNGHLDEAAAGVREAGARVCACASSPAVPSRSTPTRGRRCSAS
jgi:aminopeptidase